MASLAELEAEYNRLGELQRELNQRVRNAQTDEEAREAQAERQIVRDQIAALDPALTRARAQAATSFSLIPDPQTGGYQLRTGDGWFIASGQTAEAAKQAGLARGANPAAINALQDPAPRTRPTVQGTYRIGIQPGTGLWLVDFQAPDGRTYGMGRAALPQDAINLAQQRRQTQNDPVTGEGFYGTGDFPPIDAATLQSQADAIIAQNEAQFAASRDTQGPGTESAGETVADAADARDEGASVQNPPAATTQNDDGGAGVEVTADEGTDGRLRTLDETQANPAPTAPGTLPGGSGSTVGGQASSGPAPTNTGGVGTPGDDAANAANSDATAPTQSNDVINLVNRTARAISPQDNILDKFSSYTYSISIYLMTPEDYKRMIVTKQRFIPGYLLLIQSGGAAQESGVVPASAESEEIRAQGGVSLSQGRNQFFPLDFYIDDLEIKTINPGKGTGGAHNVTEMRFKIVEPNGITFLDRLNDAVQQYINSAGGISAGTANGQYSAQNYLMVIRWYGYDAQGNLLTAQDISSVDPTAFDKTDANAIVEKFIPFQFSEIKFRIANRLVEYDCQAVAIPNVIGTGQGRGVIPYNIELSATTLQNLFNGNEKYTTTQSTDPEARDGAASPGADSAPDKANAAPSPTLAQGLVQALNKYQKEHVDSGIYGVADVYKIVISHPEIANAGIVPPGETNRKSKPMIQATSGAQAKDGEKQSVQNDAKTVSATAGQSIVQFIDNAIRSSDYIYKQQTKIKGKDKNGKEIDIPQSSVARAFAWYTINVEAKPIKHDPKRNDYAYEITYEIAPYGVNAMKSDYFPKGRFRGVQKRYPYWFTGENTSVLNYEQDFNYLYFLTVNSAQSRVIAPTTFNYNLAEKKIFSPNSAQTNQGIEGNVNEPSANAADYLYSPATQGQVKMTIVGDPAWIAQGTLWSGVRSTKKPDSEENDVYFDAFLSDGTINYDAREVLFEVVFKKPQDYSLQTGVLRGL